MRSYVRGREFFEGEFSLAARGEFCWVCQVYDGLASSPGFGIQEFEENFGRRQPQNVQAGRDKGDDDGRDGHFPDGDLAFFESVVLMGLIGLARRENPTGVDEVGTDKVNALRTD